MEQKSFLQALIDNCPFPVALLHVILNEDESPKDFTFVYLNEKFANLSNNHGINLINKNFYEIFPDADKKWLNLYYDVSYNDKTVDKDDISSSTNTFMHITAIPGNRKGFCLIVLRDIREREIEKEKFNLNLKRALTSVDREKNFLNLLSFDYTNIYFINLSKDSYEIIKSNDKTNAYKLHGEKGQGCFSKLVKAYVDMYVVDNEKDYVLHKLSIESIKLDLLMDRKCLFHYSCFPNQHGESCYEGRIIRVDDSDGTYNALLTFRSIDKIISKEKAIQNKLQKALDDERVSNEVIRAIATMYEMILRVDLNEDYYVNIKSSDSVHKILGDDGKASLILKESNLSFVSDDYRDLMEKFLDLDTLKDRLRHEDSVYCEFMSKSGFWHASSFVVKRRDENNEVSNVVYLSRSISDQKKREDELALQVSREKRINASKVKFLSSMAHDIKTPLSAISGFTDIAFNDLDDKEKIFDCLKQIKIASKYLTQIVENNFDIDVLESGKVKIKDDNINVVEFFDELKCVLLPIALEKNVKLIVNVHDILSDDIIIDSTKIKRILFNLFNNAINYSKKDGQVVFDVSQKEDADGLKLLISVADNGVGMSSEFQEKMFDRFSREIDTRTSQIRGLGIGLSIVKEFTDLLGGDIEVDSKKDVGTTFKLEFKVKPCKIDDDKLAIIHQEDTIRILIAEDNDINYLILDGILQIYKGLYFKDVIVDRVEDGKKCVDYYFNNRNYDCILMDIQMPIMNGIEATKKIREFDKDINIIAITANSHSLDRDDCTNNGFNELIAKPIDKEKLLKALYKAME